MPDGMPSPEKSSIDAFRSLGQPSQLPGAKETAKEAEQFPQPEFRTSVPDIRMQVNANEQQEINMMDMLRAMSGRAATSGIEKFTSELQRVDTRIKDLTEIETILGTGGFGDEDPGRFISKWEQLNKEIAKAPEVLEKKYNAMAEQSLGVIDDLYRISIDQKRNAYPYDHRTAELTVKMVLETAQTLQEEESIQSPEAQVWLKRMERDATWMAGFLQVSVAQSASAPYYFDVPMQLQVLRAERFRAIISTEDMQNMHQKDPLGLEFTPPEQALIKDKGIGLAVNDKYRVPQVPVPGQEERLLKNEENLGLREIGIGMIDSSFAIRMRMAAVSQADLLSDHPEMTTFMGNNLKPEELDFYKQLLWRKDEGKILAPHMVSKDFEKKEIATILEAMLVTNAEARLNKIIASKPSGGYQDKLKAISELVQEVKGRAYERFEHWKSRGKKDIVSQLAMLVTKQGLFEDYAFLNVYKYCWQFVWNTDAEGKIISKQKVDTAGIYSYSGDAYSLYFMKRAAQYDKLGNSRTQLLLPTSVSGREEISLLPYDRMPHYEPGYPGDKDKFLAEQWNLLFGTDPASAKARRDLGYKDIPEEVANKLKSWAVRWRVPFRSKYVEEGTDYELVIPHLMPSGLDIAPFLEAITNGDKKLNKGGKSAFQDLVEGMRLSQVDWEKQENLPADKWLVDLDMASRYMNILISVFDKERDPFMGLVTAEPSPLGPKEFAKRLRLSFRDSGKGMPEEYEMAFIPFIITMACVGKYKLSTADAWELPSDGRTKTTAVEDFLKEMALWKRAFKWLPSDRPDAGLLSYNPPRHNPDGTEMKWNYGDTMALISEFYIGVLLRMSKASAEESRSMAFQNYDKTSKRINGLPFMGTGKLDRRIDERLFPRG
jgi:hypothetical protein